MSDHKFRDNPNYQIPEGAAPANRRFNKVRHDDEAVSLTRDVESVSASERAHLNTDIAWNWLLDVAESKAWSLTEDSGYSSPGAEAIENVVAAARQLRPANQRLQRKLQARTARANVVGRRMHDEIEQLKRRLAESDAVIESVRGAAPRFRAWDTHEDAADRILRLLDAAPAAVLLAQTLNDEALELEGSAAILEQQVVGSDSAQFRDGATWAEISSIQEKSAALRRQARDALKPTQPH